MYFLLKYTICFLYCIYLSLKVPWLYYYGQYEEEIKNPEQFNNLSTFDKLTSIIIGFPLYLFTRIIPQILTSLIKVLVKIDKYLANLFPNLAKTINKIRYAFIDICEIIILDIIIPISQLIWDNIGPIVNFIWYNIIKPIVNFLWYNIIKPILIFIWYNIIERLANILYEFYINHKYFITHITNKIYLYYLHINEIWHYFVQN